MNKLIYLFLLTIIGSKVYAQDCACCSEPYQAFDFWIGEWNVLDTNGNKVGENKIEKLEDNCLLIESWSGVKGSTGKSFNYYNKKDKTWNQLWIDNKGNTLKLKGNGSHGEVVMQDELQEGLIGKSYNKITWTKVNDNEVIQLWEVFSEKNERIATAFMGIYKRK